MAKRSEKNSKCIFPLISPEKSYLKKKTLGLKMVQPLRNNLKDSENLNSFRDIISFKYYSFKYYLLKHFLLRILFYPAGLS